MKYGLQFRDVFAAWEFLLDGLLVTLALSLATMVLGFCLGLLCACAKTYGGARFKKAVSVYIETIRNTPLLVQIFLLYFGLPSLGLRLEGFDAALIALVINLGAYSTEIIRAGLEAIPADVCQQIGDRAHGFDAAADDEPGIAAGQLARRQHDGLDA